MPLFVDIRRGGASSQTEIADEENQSENDQNSGESDKNVDNSGDLSTSDGSEVNADSTTSTSSSADYDDYWISDSSYMSTSWSGSGTSSDPYLIQSASDLALLSYKVFSSTSNRYSGKYFKQTCNIDLSGHLWMPIGAHYASGNSISYYFSGNYDGDGHTVSGIMTEEVWSGVLTRASTAGQVICCFLGRNFYKAYDGSAWVAWCSYTSSGSVYSGPMLLSTDPNAVAYYTSYDSSTIFTYSGTTTINGTTYYYSKCEYSVGGDVRDSAEDEESGASTVYLGDYYSGTAYSLSYAELVSVMASLIYANYYCGLFGYTCGTSSSYCKIHDVRVVDSEIVGAFSTGAVVGRAYYYSDVYNCYNSAVVTSDSIQLGGIVGSSFGYASSYFNHVYSCYNVGAVMGTNNYVGGIVGYMQYCANVYDCYNTGSVAGNYYVGGVVGGSRGCSTTYYSQIYRCYNEAPVSGFYRVGGVVGSLGESSYPCYLYNCFNVGDVTATGSSSSYYKYVGGVVGYLIAGTISNCYYGNCTITGYKTTYTQGIGVTTDTDGVTEHLDGISLLARCSSWFTSSGVWNSSYAWDFDSTWAICADVNDGLPYLLAFGDYGSEDVLQYDSTNGYWCYEDGYMPQSYYGSSSPSGLGSASAYFTVNLTDETWADVVIYENSDGMYAKVTISSDTSGTLATGWFVCEPIVWIVAYGSSLPTEITTAVTANVVTCGQVASSAGLGWSARRGTIVQSLASLESASGLAFGAVSSWTFDCFASTVSQTVVNDESVTATSILNVASVAEIDALGGKYSATCTDFVTFLMSEGATTSGSSATAYWTRDLACELSSSSAYGKAFSYDGTYNQGVYVTSDGVLSNATLKNVFGARLSIAV